jgi:anti-sigma B factor antagonist
MAGMQELAFDLTVASIAEGTHVATVSGELDLHREADLRRRLWPLADSGSTTVIVDLCDVPFLDSTALGVLTGLAARLRERDGRLVIVSDDPRLRRLLDLTGLHAVLGVETSLAKAVKSVGDNPSH